jgi:hypothetical protein
VTFSSLAQLGWVECVGVASVLRAPHRCHEELMPIALSRWSQKKSWRVPLGMAALFSAALAACAGTMPSPSAPSDVVLDSSDWRRALIGEWTVEFRLDSVRVLDGSGQRWQAGSLRTTEGTLRLSAGATNGTGVLASSLEVDFNSLLGRPMSCFDPRPTRTYVDRTDDTIVLNFTPNAADCGFSASGRPEGDSLVGRWDETSFAGPSVMGRFRMRRVRR